ncbi:hypothetical protein LUZ60_008987 [Juncus effusus]|nr:hypothetical protein LUZ60_008987 [Juncus effusus]
MFQSSLPLSGGGAQFVNLRKKPSARASLSQSSLVADPYFSLKIGESSIRSIMKESIERIREQLQNIQAPASCYDTAWVAMVPNPNSHRDPCFPRSVNWISENQNENGSWGISNLNPSFVKDNISSTLACILALKKWNFVSSEEQIKKGLHFVESNFSSIFDEKLISPIGFNLIVPQMVKLAIDMDLNLPFGESAINDIFTLQNLELKRKSERNSEGRNEYIAYISEALGRNLKDWNVIMKYQRANGSLFNSPSATAALLLQNYDSKALDYLYSLVKQFGPSVPTIYPIEIYAQLLMIDTLQKLGIARYFSDDIKRILDKIYRFWVEKNEEIISDMSTCGMAFRILRMNGYSISSDILSQFGEADKFCYSKDGYLRNMKPIVELYKASQIKIFPNEEILENLASWSKEILKTEISSNSNQIISQELLESWVKETKLDQLKFARQKLTYCYLSAASTIYFPELVNTRIIWAKNAVLTTIVDDFFDIGGSVQELENLIHLFEKWDGKNDKEFYSKQVEIVFSAIYGAINEISTLVNEFQDRDITDHLISIWLNLFKSMMIESKWQKESTIPTTEEYIQNGIVSFALGPIILPAIYFIDPKNSEEITNHEEYHDLFRLVSLCGRLLNDIQGFEREDKEGKLNILSLYVKNNLISEKEAKKEIEKSIENSRRELLQLVLKEESVVPKSCKELFWKMCKILHLFYMNNDGFSSPKEMVSAVNSVIHEPLNILGWA